MKLLLAAACTFFSVCTFGQSLKSIKTATQADEFIKANPNLVGEIIEINSEKDSSVVAKKIFDNKSKNPINIGDYTYKIIETDVSYLLRVNYIYLGGDQLTLEKINDLRQSIIAKYKSGTAFTDLAKEYNMDGSASCDFGWVSEKMFLPEFAEAIKTHKKDDIFTLDISDKKWYYVLLKTHNEQKVTTHSILKIKNSNEKSKKNTIGSLPAEDPYFVETTDTFSTFGPKSITRSVLQDKNGHLWFATWQGIMRYDGKNFANFTLLEGLKRFHFFSILEDKKGRLWFGSIGGGMYCYNGKSFVYYTTKDGLAGNSVMSMLEDMAGNIWFATDNGVSCYDGTDFTNFTTQDGLSSNDVIFITQDKSGKFWVGTEGGVSCYDPSTSVGAAQPIFTDFLNAKGLSFSNVRCIIEDKKGNIWIGHQGGLCGYNGSTQTTVTTDFIGYIFEDTKGNLWLSGSKAGSKQMTLTRYDGTDFTEVTNSLQVFGVTEDNTGNIWFGKADGVVCYNGKEFTDFK